MGGRVKFKHKSVEMEQVAETEPGEDTPLPNTMREAKQTARPNRYAIITVFLVMTVFAAGDLLEIIPYFAPLVASPLFPFFHETHALLALMVALYAAHKLSPALGWAAMAWFIAVHIPYAYLVFPKHLPELVRLAVLIVAAIFGVRIIVARSRLEAQLNELAADLEVQRTAALQRADELTILNSIATIGVEATSVDTLIENAVQLIGNTLHPDYFGIGLVDEAAGVLLVYRSARTGRGERLTVPLGEGVAGRVVATGKPWQVPDVSREPAYLAVNPGARSELCVPLKVGERVIGLITVGSRRLNAFSEADERLMTTFADQLVTAIEKAHLFQLEQRRAQEAETLRQAGAIVAATLRQDEAIERILQQLERVVPYDSASVQLLGDGYLEIVGGRGWADPAAVVGIRFPIPGDNPNTVVIQQRKPYILGNAPTAHTAFHQDPHSHIRSFLGVPLIVGDQVIGMLSVDNTQPNYYTSEHARLVTAFADQVAIAIQNARLFSQVQRLAITDELTGLYNYRHFFELAKNEFDRARRFGRPLSAVLLDLDHFKQVNDTYGHAIGNQVLRVVAERFRYSLREIDILGRYGGEEFAALLPETDLDGARNVTERLRRYVADHPVDTDRGPLAITISLGVATLGKGCTDLDMLLEHADRALYAAKQAGRNRVCVWQS